MKEFVSIGHGGPLGDGVVGMRPLAIRAGISRTADATGTAGRTAGLLAPACTNRPPSNLATRTG